MTDVDWRQQAACRAADPRLFDPINGPELRAAGSKVERHPRLLQALTICATCPVRVECGLAADVEGAAGVRGGRYRRKAAA